METEVGWEIATNKRVSNAVVKTFDKWTANKN